MSILTARVVSQAIPPVGNSVEVQFNNAQVDGGFSFPNNAEVEVSSSGVYRFSYGIMVSNNQGRYGVWGFLGSNGAALDECLSTAYIRDNNGIEEQTLSATCLLSLTAGQRVSLFMQKFDDNANQGASVEGWISVESLPSSNDASLFSVVNAPIAVTGTGSFNEAGDLIPFGTSLSSNNNVQVINGGTAIRILQAGYYRGSYGLHASTASNTRVGIFSALNLNGQRAQFGRSFGYIRGRDLLRHSVLNADFVQYFSVGDEIEVECGRSSERQVNTQVVTGWLDFEKLPVASNVAFMTDEQGGDAYLRTSVLSHPFTTHTEVGTNFNVNQAASTVTVSTTGVYRVSYNFYQTRTTNSENRRSAPKGLLLIDGTVRDVECQSIGYNRGDQSTSGVFQSMIHASCVLPLTAGQTVEFGLTDVSSVQSATTVTAPSHFYVQKLK